MALSWEGTTWSDPFSSRIPFLFKQWWSGSGGRVGHKGSPLVERHKFLVLGGLPQQTVFWNQNLTHRNQQVKGGWLLLVCHFLDALQTSDVKKAGDPKHTNLEAFLGGCRGVASGHGGSVVWETQYVVAEVWREWQRQSQLKDNSKTTVEMREIEFWNSWCHVPFSKGLLWNGHTWPWTLRLARTAAGLQLQSSSSQVQLFESAKMS